MKWEPIDTPLDIHPQKDTINYLAKHLCIHPILMHHLFLQGISTLDEAYDYFYPELTNLYNPFLLNDMKKAVNRIFKAIENKETIMIFGDYDADGITSSTIVYLALKQLGAKIHSRLPLRTEGYGLSKATIHNLPKDISLIITVDNGTSAHAAIQEATQKGIDVIVTDHHEILGKHPNCTAFINPKRHDSTYPFDGLSGAGVALKLVQALFEIKAIDWRPNFYDYLEIATLGTIADLMPLQDENRIICKFGLRKMNTQPYPVLQKLFELLGISYVNSSTLAFQIAPIFNAVGRISDPNIAANMLQNKLTLKEDLKQLIQLNEERKLITQKQFILAEQQIQAYNLDKQSIIVIHDDFNSGIIGIIASKIAEKYKKPSIVISHSGTGSARSVNRTNFSIIDAIKECGNFLKKYGGHEFAAGLSIQNDSNSIKKFCQEIQFAAQKQKWTSPVVNYHCELPIKVFMQGIFTDLISLEPFGTGNPAPIFFQRNQVSNQMSSFGKNNEHLKLMILQYNLSGFFKGHFAKQTKSNQKIDILYTHNCYNKKDLLLTDIKQSLL